MYVVSILSIAASLHSLTTGTFFQVAYVLLALFHCYHFSECLHPCNHFSIWCRLLFLPDIYPWVHATNSQSDSYPETQVELATSWLSPPCRLFVPPLSRALHRYSGWNDDYLGICPWWMKEGSTLKLTNLIGYLSYKDAQTCSTMMADTSANTDHHGILWLISWLASTHVALCLPMCFYLIFFEL